jgi:hypothetical protein
MDVEDELGLGCLGLPTAYLVGRRGEVFANESLKAITGLPDLEDPPLPFSFSGGVESHPFISAAPASPCRLSPRRSPGLPLGTR